MERSEQRQREFPVEFDLSMQGFSDGSVIRKVCEIDPLSPEQQQLHLLEIRRATLVVRGEVARFPGVLEALLQRDFCGGELSEREHISSACRETRALWLRREEPNWREAYERRLNENAALALRAFEEVFELSERPYADLMALEQQIRQLCRGGVAALSFDGGGPTGEIRARYEELALRPFEDIKAAAELIREVDAAVEPSRKVMIESNLRLVARVASNFMNRVGRKGIDAPGALDLFQEGVFGLMSAIDRFRPELGNRFSTYAMHWIKQAISKSLADNEMIAIPHHVRVLLSRERRAREQLSLETGRPPQEEEVLERMRLSPKEYRLWNQAKTIVVESTIRKVDGEEVDLLELVPTDPHGDIRLRQMEEAEGRIARVLERLFEGKMLVVMTQRFTTAYGGKNMRERPKLAEIGDELGLARQRVSQLEQGGVATLADYFIVEESRAAVRADVLGRVCSNAELAIIEGLVAERYEARTSKAIQAALLERCATALVIARVESSDWQGFSAKAGLSPLRARIVGHRVLEGRRDFEPLVKRVVTEGLAAQTFNSIEAEKLFADSMKSLAPHARAEFKRRCEAE